MGCRFCAESSYHLNRYNPRWQRPPLIPYKRPATSFKAFDVYLALSHLFLNLANTKVIKNKRPASVTIVAAIELLKKRLI